MISGRNSYSLTSYLLGHNSFAHVILSSWNISPALTYQNPLILTLKSPRWNEMSLHTLRLSFIALIAFYLILYFIAI